MTGETRDSLLTVGLAPGKTHSSDADMEQLISIWAIGYFLSSQPQFLGNTWSLALSGNSYP